MEKFTVPVGCTGAHNHSGLLGQGLASWPKPTAFHSPRQVEHAQGTSKARAARGHRAEHGQCSWHGELTGASPEL
jgi:hypothetical protein